MQCYNPLLSAEIFGKTIGAHLISHQTALHMS